ncbi:MAG: NifB/NifX family molybdenum-iron cluster-binding protein [Candidatus Competibacter sp.]|nr:NifB/NifX family molybdenum-iron cluster-binding protein [Candidatus Competibacter sp.]MDG4585402.1 NifB/NifX family molybdenum-iron cluster-binding protein [Candidatus Competibacter sp.]
MKLRRHLWIVTGGTEAAAMTTTVRLAFASSDRKRVDQHFGSACGLAIYAVNEQQATLLEFAQFGDLEQDGHEDKLAAKLALVRDCAAVYCQAIGGSAIRQLLAAGVQPIRVEEGTPVERLLDEARAALRAGTAPWLAGARRRRNDPQRFEAMEAEGWQE